MRTAPGRKGVAARIRTLMMDYDEALLRMQQNDPSLTRVHLVGKRISDEEVTPLADALVRNSSVISVNLYRNLIGAEGATALHRAFVQNSTLTKIELGGNNIGDQGAVAIAGSLASNSCNLTKISLTGSGIGNVGAKALARALPHNSSLFSLCLGENHIGDEGGKALIEGLRVSHSLTHLDLYGNNINEDIKVTLYRLVDINDRETDPQEAFGLRLQFLLQSERGTESELVSLALAELENFPDANRRRTLFGRLLGPPTERAREVAASVDADRGRALYWYAAECGAAPSVLMNVLGAHPGLCALRDVTHRLYPFMLLATLPQAGVGDVMELLLEKPDLVETGIRLPEGTCCKRKRL